MTEPEPTPVFRRFPYVQLGFCLACLSMAGWTWMRYSYAWDMVPSHLTEAEDRMEQGRWPGEAWVRLRGQMWWQETGAVHEQRHQPPPATPQTGQSLAWCRVADSAASSPVAVLAHRVAETEYPSEFVGRATYRLSGFMGPDAQSLMPVFVTVDTTASRFHPASVAGLVVGAMGVFIFGLYLRGWLRERKALASEPTQDMIA